MTDRDETPMVIDLSADWTSLGGHYRDGSTPTGWRKKKSNAWDRKELIPYGKAPSSYQEQYYRCPECNGRLFPTNVRYRFGCDGCGLVFGSGWGGLWGYPPDHQKAMWLSDSSRKAEGRDSEI